MTTIRWASEQVLQTPPSITPFYTFLFKVASRCNLDCTYCYVYHSPDQSWRERPTFMSFETAAVAADRIAEHVTQHDLPEVTVVFHGGEPLLAGPDRLRHYAEVLRTRVPTRLQLAVQTNAILLTPEILDLFAAFEIRFGISIDGDRTANRMRVFHDGRSSYDEVLRSLDLVRSRPEWSRMHGGFLSVINLQNTPESVYRAFVELGARSVDLLLPDSHHDLPPPRPANGPVEVAYGRWLADFFDCWSAGSVDMEVRYLEELMALILGGHSSLEVIGAKCVDLIVVEADGSIEPVDSLKVVGRHATNIGLNVREHSFDDALRHQAIFSRMAGYEALCSTCQQCPELDVCGGGYLPHRYGKGNDFLNPSVYCADIQFLISHIRGRLRTSILPPVGAQTDNAHGRTRTA